MAKFSGPSVTPGQPGNIVLPTDPAQGQVPTPQGTGTFIDDLADAPVEDIQAGIQAGAEAEIVQQQQLEQERIPTLKERQSDTETIHKWGPTSPPAAPSTDGGMSERAIGMAGKFGGASPLTTMGITPPTTEARTAAKAGDTAQVATIASANKPGSLVAAFNRIGGVNSNQRTDGTWSNEIDPALIMTGSVVTEKMFAESAFGDTEGDIQDIDPESQAPTISKGQGNAALGQEIAREYQRLRNQAQGVPTDQYQDIPREEANTLGDAFKEVWAQSNPSLMKVERTPGGQTFFQLTPEGVEKMKASAPTRKKLFPKVKVRPAKAPTKTGQLPGEHGRTVVKRTTGKVKQPLAGASVLQEATRNLNSVPNVVDTQRLRILYTTILPVLSGELDFNTWQAGINNIGKDKMASFAAEQNRRERVVADGGKADPFDAADEMGKLQNKVAQEVRAIAQERKGANYLTYDIQTSTGRINPQQLYFNPTSSKACLLYTSPSPRDS